jgi:ammonia channel protein AmtB
MINTDKYFKNQITANYALYGFCNFFAGYSVASPQSAINTGRAVTLLAYSVLRFKQWDLSFAMNGLLAGVVASCSGVNVYPPWVAVIFVGPLGAIGYYLQTFTF